MVWNYPEISKEDLMKLLKGFVDMLILASGFQSSGDPAHWDVENCRKALQWGLFFENVMKSITCSDMSGETMIDLDETISELKSNALFPKTIQGLENLSSVTLSKGREFVLEHLMNNPTSKDKQLKAILVAAVESGGGGITDMIEEKLCKRQSAVSCVSALETGLNTLHKNIGPKEPLYREDKDTTFLGRRQQRSETWNLWQSKCLSYFLSKRTLRLVSGASLIFSAPKAQWVEVLRRLHVLDEDIFLEKIVRAIVTRMCNKQMDSINRKHHVEEILEYLTEILESRFHYVWKLPSYLTAAAIPSWSPLFGLYIGEIEKQLKLDLSTKRCCSCDKDPNEHKDCEIAERVWCLYVFHILQNANRKTISHLNIQEDQLP